MKEYDFSKTGQMPGGQDRLKYMQNGYKEALVGIAKMGDDGIHPFCVSGYSITRTLSSGTIYTYAWNDMVICFNGEIIRMPAGTVNVDESTHAAYVELTRTAGTLTYNDGSTPAVELDVTAVITSWPIGTVDDASKFFYQNLFLMQVALGAQGKEVAWSSLVVNTLAGVGGVTGTIFYRKNLLTNTLHMRAFLTSNNAQNFAASPAALYSLMGTLPAAYWPIHDTYFTAYYFLSSLIKDDLGVSWIKTINCGLNSGGQISVNWLRPDVAISGYAININAIIPLD